MIIVTTDSIPQKRTLKTFGLVVGNTVRTRHIGKDIIAGLRGLVGGEVHEYTKLMAESREQALDNMITKAQDLGANAIVQTHFTTSYIAANMAELLAYGTAVLVDNE